jgi:hypothetical protein
MQGINLSLAEMEKLSGVSTSAVANINIGPKTDKYN